MIHVSGLVKKFGDFTAVDHISFDVAKGEIFAFLGPNGAGKTTTIKMLTTLLTPTGGTLEIDGLDLRKHANQVRQKFGIVFQDPSLDGNMTCLENMDMHGVFYHVPRKLRLERTEYLLKLFELWDRRDAIVQTFSGGMKRRLEIARGLLHTPKILFLDEPTLGLDPQTRNQLWTHVKHLNQTEQVTVFLTTHYMDEAERVAQRIAIIDHGKIVAEDTPQGLRELTGKPSLEEAFLELTGSTVRDEAGNSTDQLRQMAKMWKPAMSVIYVMWLRELKRYVRSKAQFAVSLAQPLLYLFALGFGMGPVFQKAGQGNYVQFMAPGVIAMTILFSSVFSGIGLLFDRQFGFLKETLVAPVPRFQVMFGRTLGASTVAVLQGTMVMLVCIIAGFRVVNWAQFPLAILFMSLIACLFAALGTAIGSVLENMQGFQLVMNFMVMPIFFLSGALYPLANLPKLFSIIVSLDPLAYGVDALRTVLIGRGHYSIGLDALVMIIFTCVFLAIGTRLFSRIQA